MNSAAPVGDPNHYPTSTTPADRPLVGIANLDLALIVRQANEDFLVQCRPDDEVYGRSIYEFVHAAVRVPLQRQFGRLVDGELDRFVAPLAQDGPASGELTGTAVKDATNKVAGVTVLIRIDPIPAQRTTRLAAKPVLTPVHAKLLKAIALGASTNQLAGQLHLSRQGVEYHITSLLRKLNVSNRAALVSKAHAMGLLGSDIWPSRLVAEVVGP